MSLRMKKALGTFAFLFISILVLGGCGTSPSVPQPPTIELYLHFAQDKIALCSRSDDTKCPSLPISQTDRFFMLKPQDWQALNDYIDLLILQIESPQARQMVIEEKRRIMNNFYR